MSNDKLIDKINSENPINDLNIILYITPEPYARPRVNYSTGAIYNPKNSYKKKIEILIKEQLRLIDNFKIPNGPIEMEIYFGIKPPKYISDSKLKSEFSLVELDEFKKLELNINIMNPVTVKPDIDNFIKPVQDAANGILYKDDAQIYKIGGIKYYSNIEFINIRMKYREDKIKFR